MNDLGGVYAKLKFLDAESLRKLVQNLIVFLSKYLDVSL